MSTIHLIGSEGFIGKAVQKEASCLSIHNWSHSLCDPQHHFDLFNTSTWQVLLSYKPTHVMLASWPGLPNYNDTFHITQNLPACIELIDKLIENGLRRILILGTCYEYGLQNGCLQETQLTDPVNCYAISKDSLRRIVASRCVNENLQWCWARIFYPYGVGQNANSLVPSLIRAIKNGDQKFCMGSGRQVRDFIDVRTVAIYLLKLMLHHNANGIYNIGSGVPRSVLELAEEVVFKQDSSIQLMRSSDLDRTDEPFAFWADNIRLNSLLVD